MQRITDSVFLHQDTCNVYVIRSGREAVLVDFGDGSVLDRLAEVGVDRVTDVLMTHHHRDQGQGLPRAVAHGARIWVPHQEQDLFHSVDTHWQARELYNNYNPRQDLFSLLEPVPVAGTLKDYARHLGFTVIPTPGHTIGSVTLLADIDGQRLAFCGDLLYGPGKVWSLAATQWSYNGGEGIPGTILSLLDLKERQPDLLLPSHGAPMPEPAGAIDLTVERLADLRTLRRHNPRLFLLRETPYERITPHVLKNRTSMSNAYVLLSESGKALCIDFGYDFLYGHATGADRASRRPWLYTIPALKQQFGVSAIDVVLPTHYHDDHVAGLNLLREAEGAQVWVPDRFADVLEHPERYDLPCLWYDPIPADRRLPLGPPIRWEEYELTLYPLSGHTYYAVAIVVEVDGKRVLFQGDQWGDGDGLFLNYVYKNGFRMHDYRETAELLRRIRPDLILGGHWEPITVTDEYLAQVEERGRELERLHHDLLPLDEVDLGASGFGAEIQPFHPVVRTGESFPLTVLARNPYSQEEPVSVRLVLPEGWTADRLEQSARCGARTTGELSFTVTVPPGVAVRRARIAADLTAGGRRLGEQAVALITVVHEGDG